MVDVVEERVGEMVESKGVYGCPERCQQRVSAVEVVLESRRRKLTSVWLCGRVRRDGVGVSP